MQKHKRGWHVSPEAMGQNMADMNFTQFEAGYASARPQAARLGHYVNVAGALGSVALVVGLGLWGYQLAVRDVSGIPVIRALQDPMRIAPETPGGEVISHSGLSVNAVAASGGVVQAAELIALAPRPVDLAPEDTPGITGLDAPAPLDAADVPLERGLELAPLVELAPPVDQREAVARALAEALDLDETPIAPVETTGADGAVNSGFLPDEGLAMEGDLGPAPKRPLRRPGAAAALSAVEPTVAETPAASAPIAGEVDPATIAAGTRLAQLGAFDTAEGARAEWSRLQARFGELLADKAPVIQSAQSGGRTFHRLRAAGFASEADARRFCAALSAENATCIPVAQR